MNEIQDYDGNRISASGVAFAGKHFYVWDESAEVASRWASRLARAEEGRVGSGESEDAPPRILVPVDFSPACEAAARHAQRLAKRDDGEIHLLHVAPSPAEMDEVPRTVPALRSLRERILARLRELAAGLDAPTATHLFAGDPGAVIRETARGLDADVMVMGAHTDEQPGKVGSLARAMQERAPCPVHLIGPPPA